MRRRHPVPSTDPPRTGLPRVWLMTDSRMGEALWEALDRLPRGAGVVFRHYGAPDRDAVYRRVRQAARRRRLVLLVAGGHRRGADGVHNGRVGHGLRSRSAHSRRDLVAAVRARADVVFVSPVYPTRSHPGAGALGRRGLATLLRYAPMPAIALGGMTAARFRPIRSLGAYGWAGIDAWLAPDQKRKAVPT